MTKKSGKIAEKSWKNGHKPLKSHEKVVKKRTQFSMATLYNTIIHKLLSNMGEKKTAQQNLTDLPTWKQMHIKNLEFQNNLPMIFSKMFIVCGFTMTRWPYWPLLFSVLQWPHTTFSQISIQSQRLLFCT